MAVSRALVRAVLLLPHQTPLMAYGRDRYIGTYLLSAIGRLGRQPLFLA